MGRTNQPRGLAILLSAGGVAAGRTRGPLEPAVHPGSKALGVPGSNDALYLERDLLCAILGSGKWHLSLFCFWGSAEEPGWRRLFAPPLCLLYGNSFLTVTEVTENTGPFP